ncbi:MAG: flagellar basal body P-ring formation protein FlgA [Candidatus Saganbacteria bacterium]|nr:flagellar basal body P-ring formation protein FlgA [Candidatus Saganbacteria bacterium]
MKGTIEFKARTKTAELILRFCPVGRALLLLAIIVNWSLVLGHLSFCRALDDPEQRVSETIRNYVVGRYPDWANDRIDLTFRQAEGIFAEMKELPETVSLEVLEVYPDFRPVGSVVFPLVASCESGGRKYLVRAKVEVFKNVVAAARLIKKGTLIGPDDLKLDERDVALLPPKYFTAFDRLISQEAKISVPDNSTVFEWMIGAVPLVHRGDEVTLTVAAPGLTVKVKARAEEDGVLGAEIKVKRKDSNKILPARVVAAGEVEVKVQ